jgi:hypothetical protein
MVPSALVARHGRAERRRPQDATFSGLVISPDYVDSNGTPRVNVGNTGSGKAIVFKEGKAITGTWKKDSDSALTHYYDDSGSEIPLVRGEIFMQSVPPDMAVTYK